VGRNDALGGSGPRHGIGSAGIRQHPGEEALALGDSLYLKRCTLHSVLDLGEALLQLRRERPRRSTARLGAPTSTNETLGRGIDQLEVLTDDWHLIRGRVGRVR
jgi:hypothetical protein